LTAERTVDTFSFLNNISQAPSSELATKCFLPPFRIFQGYRLFAKILTFLSLVNHPFLAKQDPFQVPLPEVVLRAMTLQLRVDGRRFCWERPATGELPAFKFCLLEDYDGFSFFGCCESPSSQVLPAGQKGDVSALYRLKLLPLIPVESEECNPFVHRSRPLYGPIHPRLPIGSAAKGFRLWSPTKSPLPLISSIFFQWCISYNTVPSRWSS